MALRDTDIALDIMADADPLRGINNQINDVTRNAMAMANTINGVGGQVVRNYRRMSDSTNWMMMSTRGMSQEALEMRREMTDAYTAQRKAMQPFRNELIKTQYDFFKLSKSAKDYKGTAGDFIIEVEKMGKAHKKVMDNMMANNEMAKMSFIQSVGTMLARSNSSEKIAANFDRMKNPMYSVNKPLLAITNGLENIAKAGQPAVLALKMLGPTANMKELRDMTMLITQGVMRFQMVALGAAVVSGIMLAVLTKAAMGPNPAEVRARQAEVTAVYEQAFAERVNEIRNFTGLFEKASLEPIKKWDIMSALQSQVTSIKTWMTSLKELTAKGVDEGLIKELQKAGPAAAMEVAALNRMTQPELDKYVGLWREKSRLATQQATTELAKLKSETQKKVKELQDSLMPLGVEVEKFKNVWAVALKPFIEMFSLIASKVVHVGTVIGAFFARIAESNPILSKMVFGFLSLLPILTLLLSPLAVGIGLFNGMKAAFASVWLLIKPLVAGLAAMGGTVLVVATIIVALAAAFYLLWTRNETFRNGVINAWNQIKAKAVEVFTFIKPYIMQAIGAVGVFIQQKLQQIQQFWNQHGAMIMQALQNLWGFIKIVMAGIGAALVFIWPLVQSIIVGTWNAIKNVINGAIQIIMGIIRAFSALFTGNWSELWAAIKQILMGALQMAWGLINLYFIGRLLGPLRTFGTMAGGILRSAWAFIKGIFMAGVNGIKSLVMAYFNLYRNIIFGSMRAIQTVVTTIWRALRGSVSAAVGSIRASISSSFSTARSIVVNIMQAIGSIIRSVWNAAKSLVNGAVRAIYETVRGKFEALKTVVSTAMKNVTTAIKTGWNAAKSFLQSINLSSIGKNIIQGLVSGITSAMGAVKKAVSGLADMIPDFLKKKMGIHSPARVMIPLGGFATEGVAVGMQDQMKLVESASREIAMTVQQPVAGITPETSSSSSTTNNSSNRTINFNPTIQVNGGDSGSDGNVRQQVRDAMDEAFAHLLDLYDPEVSY